MRKILMMILLAIGIGNCQPTQVNVDVTWSADTTAQGYIVVVAEGSDTTNWPIAEDMAWQDVDTTKLMRIYHLATVQTGVGFLSSINGEFIQAAGIVIGEFGLTSLLTTSNMEKKPNVPNKMEFINLSIGAMQ
jgi:hypothetical protein